jgi:hypothetical protein
MASVDDLAHWLVHRANKSRGLLYRNAHAIAKQYGNKPLSSIPEGLVKNIDELVTLRALEMMSEAHRKELHDLIKDQPEAMNRLIRTVGALSVAEALKDSLDPANTWKGWVPESRDPRKQIRLANAEQAKELVRQGWTKLETYKGDAADVQKGLAYYVSTSAGEVTYSQGALQMVVNTAGGTMAGTGQTLSDVTGLAVTKGSDVIRIANEKRMGRGDPSTSNMLPIFRFNTEEGVMEIIAFERTLDAGLVQAHTKGDNDLAVGIGIWMGRQAEEQLARGFNMELVDELKQLWDKEQVERIDEYVALNVSDDPIDKDTWEAIPEHTKALLLRKFDNKVMVRRDIRNNAFGYRNFSVREVFGGVSDLNPMARKAIETVAYGLMGKYAQKFLSTSEDVVQGAVSVSKDLIVVRSGIVAFVNIVANQLQALSQGVPLSELPRQFKIAKQIETYLRNEHRLARIQVEMKSTDESNELTRLNGEAARIQEENQRLDIYELIQAGELPTIAEGLSETDEYTLLGDATKWLEERTKDIPQGIKDVGRYALITKDTALYQGMNRLIQFGDLMAKQLVYEKKLRDGVTKEEALSFVRDNFVNYNILPGRLRTALEQMGILWFWSYKLRIQKIFFRAIRDNPLRALTMFGAADVSGVDSLWSSQVVNANLSYSIGYEQLMRAHEMNLWSQVFPD